MKHKTKLGVLLALVAVFVAVNLWRENPPPGTPASVASPTKKAGRIPDLSLRVDLLKPGTRRVQPGRNIFEYRVRQAAAPPPPPPAPVVAAAPAPEPPPPAPFRFYGFAEDSQSGKKRVFLTDGEEIFIASEGDTLLRRYRVTRIRAGAIELEDLVGGRQWVVPLEQP